MPYYMLDTNIASLILKGRDPYILSKVTNLPPGSLVISVITEAELLFGLQKRRNPALEARVEAFTQQVDVLPWDREVARCYARLRHRCEQNGTGLSPMDMLIASHAIAVGATLVSREKAFTHVLPDMETWQTP